MINVIINYFNSVLDEKSRPSIISWFNKVIYFYLALSILILLINPNSIYAYIFAIALTFSCMQLILPLARAQDKSVSFALISILGTLMPSLAVILNSFLNSSLSDSLFSFDFFWNVPFPRSKKDTVISLRHLFLACNIALD